MLIPGISLPKECGIRKEKKKGKKAKGSQKQKMEKFFIA